MLQELLTILPREPGTLALAIALIGTAIGAALCAAGARFSRPLITLITVLLGATLGMSLPRWMDLSISGAGPAVGGAIVLGLTGWVLHRFWIGVGLGLVLSSWTTLIVWVCWRNGQTLHWPAVNAGTTLPMFLMDLWHALPRDVARLLPAVTITAMVSGVAASILWDRPIVVLMWSAVGATMLAIMGTAAIDYGKPELLKQIDIRPWLQVLVFVLLIGVSMLVQYKVAPVQDSDNSNKKNGKKQPAEGAD